MAREFAGTKQIDNAKSLRDASVPVSEWKPTRHIIAGSRFWCQIFVSEEISKKNWKINGITKSSGPSRTRVCRKTIPSLGVKQHRDKLRTVVVCLTLTVASDTREC
mmetsp:Transcript_101704/g.158784  ORF Transcript_101704/g.158784 Transcript_101704/m.158784 type:complete len:106 (+) Transcript_101704:35-352(+)